ncbi:hypothetical protein OQA88_6191 [Cercophora sp. LCS_1]
MATPNNNVWSAPSPQPTAQASGGDEYGLQARPMGLKVQYTFDRESRINCLAKWPHILQIPTMPLNEATTIGVIDLRTCLQAIARCSPEIVNQHDIDYSIYATDYSEPDFPLVGQGMLSEGLDQGNEQSQQQMVTGRVTRNIMAFLGNGSRDTLEVKLKLTGVARVQPVADFSGMSTLGMSKFASTPTETTSEWGSFIQSNPTLGHSANVAAMTSPALPPAQLSQPNSQHGVNGQGPYMDMRHDLPPHQPPRHSSIPPQNTLPQATMPPMNIAPAASNGPPRVGSPAIAPQPVEVNGKTIQPVQPSRPSRPSSRSRTRVPTGRPRGRPRKKPLETGNTSAAEEAIDSDDGPQKKRAKVTQAEYSTIAPFGAAPDSLRVAASISGSIRNMRPVGSGVDVGPANHLQDVPRAPTPVPDMPLMHKQQQRMRVLEKQTRSDAMELENGPAFHGMSSQSFNQRGTSQDALSPADSMAQSPDQGYSPEDSPADLGSSPPVPRAGAYMRSSPPASSPILPPMPMREVDSGFMSGGIDDMFDEDEMVQELPQAKMQELPQQRQTQPLSVSSAPMGNSNIAKSSRSQQPTENFPFHEVQPGPRELLPTTSLFNPAGKVKSLNRPPAPPAIKKPASRSFKRSNTAPSVVAETTSQSQEKTGSQQTSVLTDSFNQQPQSQVLQDTRNCSPPTIEAVLHQALSEEVGSEAPETDNARRNSVAPMANIAPIPDRPVTTEPILTLPTISRPPSRPTSRPASRGPQPPVPASDPVPEAAPTLSQAFMSEAPGPIDDDPPRYSKNQVKKQSIKERLETAIQKGESPPFCSNCGAIETPTWRKIWTQEHAGVPDFHEFSDKPGCVTMIDVLERDKGGQVSMYRLIKKHLGPTEDKKFWNESVLCNPCGIWLAKFKGHRPPDRWEKDAARLGQPRRKRENRNGNGKGKKARTKSDGQMNPTSEAYFTTDPLGPADVDFLNGKPADSQNDIANNDNQSQSFQSKSLNLRSSPKHRGPGSTHSRGSGTADSPIALEDDLGTTRRLLFPSPRKDGVPKVLGELTTTNAQTNTTFQEPKSAAVGKENAQSRSDRPGTPVSGDQDDLDQELFGTPPARPSTPPCKSMSSGVFKTPTRPTPSHRPITRSISRSIRTVRSIVKSPGQLFNNPLLKTPSKTPRSGSGSGALQSTGKRRSPRNAHLHAHFALEDMHFDSPFTATLNQLLSEANEFTAGSPSHGLVDLDLNGLPNLPSDLDNDAMAQHLTNANALDFGNFLSTDLVMPSSPPLLRNNGGNLNFGGTFSAGDLWAQLAKGVDIEGLEPGMN